MTSESPPVLSLVVTAHREGRLLRPTLRSLDAAIDVVRHEHGDVQVIVVCDKADEQTLAQARSWAEARQSTGVTASTIEVSLGESGAARNAGADVAEGVFVAFVDGDDLVSERFLADAVSLLSREDVPTVMHPETVLSFGARSLLWHVDSARASDIDYRDLLRHNLWPSCGVMRRTTARTHPYLSFPPEDGFGPEDWIWNIATTAAGVVHDTVPDSLFFYRVRGNGGVNDRHSGSLLPPFDLPALRAALPLREGPPSAIRRPGVHGVYAKLLPVARRSTWWMSHEARSVLYRGARAAYRFARRGNGLGLGEHATPGPVQVALHAACELDPSISWAAHDFPRLPYWRPRDDGYGAMLDETLRRIGDRAGAIVAAPWVGIGGADFVALNYARGLQASERFRDRTVILGTFLGERTVHENIPGDVLYHHLPAPWLDMQPHLRRRFIAQLLVLLAPELVVSVSSFHVTEALQDYAPQLTTHSEVFATLFAFDRIGAGYPVNPITDDAQRRYLDSVSGIITDNTTTGGLLRDILALPDDRIIVQRQPVTLETPDLVRATPAYHNRYFSTLNPFRLIWPHRLDEEKRPDTVVAIARELRRRGLPAVVDVWGQRVLTTSGGDLMRQMQDAGVMYRGPYTGGLTTLPTHEYHALLLTSQSEGLPLVLVQSLLAGLPVIASAVGGVPDIIVDGETGLLASGPDDIAGFVDAIERLMGSLELRRSLIERGYERTVALHSWSAFRDEVDAQFSAGAALTS